MRALFITADNGQQVLDVPARSESPDRTYRLPMRIYNRTFIGYGSSMPAYQEAQYREYKLDHCHTGPLPELSYAVYREVV